MQRNLKYSWKCKSVVKRHWRGLKISLLKLVSIVNIRCGETNFLSTFSTPKVSFLGYMYFRSMLDKF